MANPFKLKNGTLLISTEASGGIYNAMQLKKIATLIEEDTALIKVTEDQRIALFVKESEAANIATELQSVGLGIRHYQDGLHYPTVCIGELCQKFKQDALGTAMQISEELQNFNSDQRLKIGINGCDSCCVPTHTLDISLVGMEQGYSIHLGGKNSQVPELASFVAEGVPSELVPSLLKAIIDAFKEEALPEESLQNLIERKGLARFIKILSPYSQDANSASIDDLLIEADSNAPQTQVEDSLLLQADEILKDQEEEPMPNKEPT